MLYNRKAVMRYVKDNKILTKLSESDKPKVSFSSDFWIGLDITIRDILNSAIRRSANFRRMTASELGLSSKLLKKSNKENYFVTVAKKLQE